ncbi:potassium voltage-gated channel subfamily A member 7-like [Paramacrobiotus metropolitanus]|uniref:potassium voltage-gated channel subfamily A member 7-like n=1 Tax=Paramacrobiotus metropolitanus TaxID=2943436 RepID=UPI002445A8AF|nr:potassium voltage-gated channel subfamily A member 7-like [Paramacrobiotus metropolitanus]
MYSGMETTVIGLDILPTRPDRIRLNISGKKYDIPAALLHKHPHTLLGDQLQLALFFDPSTAEYYFPRDPKCFSRIIQYYHTGTLHRPARIPLAAFIAECRFFQLDKPALLQIAAHEGFQPYPPVRLPKNRVLRATWRFLTDAGSSRGARAFEAFNIIMILLSVVILCAQSMPQFRSASGTNGTKANDTDEELTALDDYVQFTDPFFIIATVCIAWFTVEFALRLLSSPSKLEFLRAPLNIIDLLAILPYYIDVAVTVSCLHVARSNCSRYKTGIMVVLRVLRVMRMFRLIRLSRYSHGLRVLGETFVVSVRELGLFLMFLGLAVVLFSSSVFYAEIGMKETQFNSIPESFWWTIVTMTTVGYGDVTPKGLLGKIVGACCAISGLIAIALPIPVIVANFNAIYTREKLRSEMEQLLGDVLNVPPKGVPGTKSSKPKVLLNGPTSALDNGANAANNSDKTGSVRRRSRQAVSFVQDCTATFDHAGHLNGAQSRTPKGSD